MPKKSAIKLVPNDSNIIPGSPEDYFFDSYENVPEEEPSYIWPDVLPTGGISLLEGDPSAGKSSVAVGIMNHVIRQIPFPDGSVCPYENAETIYLCNEVGKDGIVSSIIRKYGIPKSKVHLIRGEELTLSDPRIRKGLSENNVRLLIVDPMQEYFDGNMYNPISTRRELARLVSFAVEHDAAVLLIRHFGKEKKRVAQHDGLGSVDISAIARSILQVDCPDPHSPIRFLKQVKNNYAVLGPDMAFELVDRGVISWIGPVLDDEKKSILDAQMKEDMPETAATMIDMYKMLKDGDVPSTESYSNMLSLGHSRSTIGRAKELLQVESKKRGRGKWVWHLPEEVTIDPDLL